MEILIADTGRGLADERSDAGVRTLHPVQRAPGRSRARARPAADPPVHRGAWRHGPAGKPGRQGYKRPRSPCRARRRAEHVELDEPAMARAGAALARMLERRRRGGACRATRSRKDDAGPRGPGGARARRRGSVSPTFAIVQPYEELARRLACRPLPTERPVGDGGAGARRSLLEGALLVEWPDRAGEGAWPQALRLTLRPLPDGRRAALTWEVPEAWEGRWPPPQPMIPPASCDRFLAAAGWEGARVEPLAGDASFRRYFRVHHRDGRRRPDGCSAPARGPAPVRRGRRMAGGERVERARHPCPRSRRGLLLLSDFGDVRLRETLDELPTGSRRCTASPPICCPTCIRIRRCPACRRMASPNGWANWSCSRTGMRLRSGSRSIAPRTPRRGTRFSPRSPPTAWVR